MGGHLIIRGITFDMRALVYGPAGAEFLSEVLQAESISAGATEVEEALGRLPEELRLAASAMRSEEQEDDYWRSVLPALLPEVGVRFPTDALVLRLLEAVHEAHAYWSMYPETLPVLQELKNRGLRLAVVSNWAPSLGRFVREFELDSFVDVVVSSAEAGLAKPDPYIFHQALKRMGLKAEEVLHCGPSLQEDVTGALRAGMSPVWLNRTGISTGHEVLTITDLRGLLMIAKAV